MKRLLSLKGSRGENTVEFAMVAVILFLVTFGIIEAGRIFTYWLIITNEARENARYGAVSMGDPAREPTLVADVEDRVRQRTAGLVEQSQLTPTVIMGSNDFTVHIEYKVRILAAPLLAFFPNLVPLTAISTMRNETAAPGGG